MTEEKEFWYIVSKITLGDCAHIAFSLSIILVSIYLHYKWSCMFWAAL